MDIYKDLSQYEPNITLHVELSELTNKNPAHFSAFQKYLKAIIHNSNDLHYIPNSTVLQRIFQYRRVALTLLYNSSMQELSNILRSLQTM
jgi:hypothetical protein